MAQENVELTRRALDALDRGDLDEFVAFHDPSCEIQPLLAAVAGDYHGYAGVREWLDDLFGAFPDFRIRVDDVRELGERTLARTQISAHGAHGMDSAVPMIDQPSWVLSEIHNGRVVWWTTFRTEREALEAAGLSDRDRAGSPIENPRAVVLVEGASDKVALETLARRRGLDLAGEGVSLVATGGAHGVGRFLERYGPAGAGVRLAGLCDAGEEGELVRALERAGFGAGLGRAEMERAGFYVCDRDLEDELIRCLGAPAVEDVLAAHGKLGSFRTYQKQPAHRGRATEEQLRGFMTNWKIELAAPLVEALDLERVPRPLDRVLAHVQGEPM